MSQPFAFEATKNNHPTHTASRIFAILALSVFILGSLLLSLGWFGVGMTLPPDKHPYMVPEARGFLFIIVWPVTMLISWICSLIALLLAKRWVLASLSLPAAIAILYAVWYPVALYMLNASAVMFTAFLLLLVTGATWLAVWFLRSTSH